MSFQSRTHGSLLVSACALFLLLAANAWAAVTLDGTVGAAGLLTGPDYVIPDTVGQTRAANLFHSFGQLSLTSSESATFTGPSSIQNIIGRVTGGDVSSIDGRLSSQIPGANLYLINPSGIVFGPNAQLDVSGSFHASTADYLRLAEGGRFDVREPGASILTAAPPIAFGFLGAAPAPIQVQGASLVVPTGKDISLIGGNLDIAGSGPDVPSLAAPSGRINLASVAAAGEVVVTPQDVQVDSFSVLGDVQMTNFAFLDARGDPGGQVFIRGGRLIIDNADTDFSQEGTHSAISAASTGNTDHPGTAIDIQLAGDMQVHGAEISASSFGAGSGGDIRISADRVDLAGAAPSTNEPFGRVSIIAARVFDGGQGGDIDISAREVALGDLSVIVTQVFGSGKGGDIDIAASRLQVSGPNATAFISAATFAAGDAGSLAINADAVTLSGGSGGFVGLATQVSSGSQATANAGDLTINATRLDILDGAQISAGIFSGSGVGGSVNVTADEIFISGRNPGGFAAGIFSDVNGAPTTGVGGDLAITTGNLTMTNSGTISAAAGLTQGAAGNVQIEADAMDLSSGATIQASTFGTRDAGDVSIDAGTLRLTGPSPTGELTGIFALAGVNGGNAGGIRVHADEVQVRDGAQIDSSTTGPGAGGNIDIEADQVLVAGHDDINNRRSSISASTRVFSTFGSFATGQGGNVNINAQRIELLDRGLITVDSSSLGDGGNLQLTAEDVSLFGGSSISATSSATGTAGNITIAAGTLDLRDSDISTRADQSDGGNVSIAARALLRLHDSSITASVSGGAGHGGNIAIDPDFVVLNRSLIAADAFGGNGGSVSIVAGQFVASPDSSVTASSAFGLQGNVVIRAPSEDISGELQRLPETALDASSLFKSGCAAVGSGYSRFNTSAPSPTMARSVGAYLPSNYAGTITATTPTARVRDAMLPGRFERVALVSRSGCER